MVTKLTDRLDEIKKVIDAATPKCHTCWECGNCECNYLPEGRTFADQQNRALQVAVEILEAHSPQGFLPGYQCREALTRLKQILCPAPESEDDTHQACLVDVKEIK